MSTVKTDIYLFFTGNCREAMEFYKEVFGGELKMQTHDEIPEENRMANMTGKVMHAHLTGGDVELMASDSTRDSFSESFISISLGGTDKEKLTSLFNKLAEGGKVTGPLKKEIWGDTFGTLTDKFGVDWMVNITAKTEEAK